MKGFGVALESFFDFLVHDTWNRDGEVLHGSHLRVHRNENVSSRNPFAGVAGMGISW